MNAMLSKIVESMKAKAGFSPLPTPVDLDRPIEGAADDAQVLVAFAAQSQRAIDDALLKQLVEAREVVVVALAAGRALTAQEQTDFWSAYCKLASTMAPLNAHSVRSSMRINAKRGVAAFNTPTAGFASLAIAVFLASIFVQSYWVAGKDLLEKADAIEKERTDLAKEIVLSRNARAIAEAKASRLASRLCELGSRCAGVSAAPALAAKSGARAPAPAPAPKPSTPAEQTEIASLTTQLDALSGELVDKRAQLELQTTTLADLNERGKPVTELLRDWHTKLRGLCDQFPPVDYLCLSDKKTENDDLDASRKALATEQWALDAHKSAPESPGTSAWAQRVFGDPERLRLESRVRDARAALASLESAAQRKTAHEVRLILSNLASFAIPLAMGLLGSLAYVLQLLTLQLREHTYVPQSLSGSIVRLCLGAIAGVFGVLALPGTDTVLRGLPPLLVPFVFGYGIEILFSLLNRIVRTFTQADSPTGKTP